MFDLKNNLEIIIITYNRCKKLSKLSSDIFAIDSPIRDCSITYIDNHSTDDTKKYLNELSIKHKNINYIRNKYNIGGSANVVKAIEITSKKYFWILCDDDRLDFTHWKYIEEALKSDNYDIIQLYYNSLVHDSKNYKTKLSKFIIESVFIPSNIYKKDSIDNNVICMLYKQIYTIMPHILLSISIINNTHKKTQIYFSSYKKQIVLQGDPEPNYTRTEKSKYEKLHIASKNIDWQVGFSINIFNFLKDKTIRSNCMYGILSHGGLTLSGTIFFHMVLYIASKKYDNIFELYNACNKIQKYDFYNIVNNIIDNCKKTKKCNINSLHVFSSYKDNKYILYSILGLVNYNKNIKLNSLFSVIISKKKILFNFLFIFKFSIYRINKKGLVNE